MLSGTAPRRLAPHILNTPPFAFRPIPFRPPILTLVKKQKSARGQVSLTRPALQKTPAGRPEGFKLLMSFRFDVLLRNGQQAVKGDPSSFLSSGTDCRGSIVKDRRRFTGPPGTG